MANPGLQLTDARFTGAAAYAACDYGGDATPTPYGGHNYPGVSIPLVQLGSDDLAETQREYVSEVALSRYGHTVAARTFATANLWTVNYNGVTETEMETLRLYFAARVFYLLPDSSDDTTSKRVKWIGTEFRPVYAGGGLYSLTFDLEELLT